MNEYLDLLQEFQKRTVVFYGKSCIIK